jgi:predicted nucleic acid-binding protein
VRSGSDAFFVDANVLVYAAVEDEPRNKACKALLQDSSGGALHISSQIVTEFYSTITSARRVTNPYSPREAVKFIEILLAYIHVFVLPISRDVPGRLLTILKTNPVQGPQVFDLQIVATMLAHGVTKLFTYNTKDFRQFTDLELFEPAHVSLLP